MNFINLLPYECKTQLIDKIYENLSFANSAEKETDIQENNQRKRQILAIDRNLSQLHELEVKQEQELPNQEKTEQNLKNRLAQVAKQQLNVTTTSIASVKE